MALKDLNIGFIGGGKMAEAIIKGVLASKASSPKKIIVSEPNPSRREYLEKSFPGIKILADNCALVKKSDLVVLAVKPDIMEFVLREISRCINIRKNLILSIAAGIPLDLIEAYLPEGTRVIRVMPNTPALVQAAVSVYTDGHFVTDEDLALAEEFLKTFGIAIYLPEMAFDAVTGLSGSGPAFVAAFIEGLIDAGVHEGLPREVAQTLVLETILGTVKLMKEAGKNPYEIKSMVASPGGTTISGLKAMEKGAFKGVIMDTVSAATERSREITDQIHELLDEAVKELEEMGLLEEED
ncbi:pyrroline-5-carboxylate reductase [Thermodesulfatator atlanticus]|uniref:pyrroline-5-carboxylate reductase n=1 Tax=Thermodesulfatator atlanticus TaxID=501497 RepID=UPI0003B6A6FA|nr:pyrroline-5-carboxylate reductase [Thermodesulfatator atlanticus]